MNNEYNEEQPINVESTHPGMALREAREAIGLSDQDVADRLRLRVSVIQDLEENCCDDEKVTTFTRGYIRSYSKLVGLNADELLSTFNPVTDVEDSTQKMQSFSRKTRRDQHDSRVMGLTWVILAIVIGLTAFWWWQNQQNDLLLSLPESSGLSMSSTTEATPATEAAPAVAKTDDDTRQSASVAKSTDAPASAPDVMTREPTDTLVENTAPDVTDAEPVAAEQVDVIEPPQPEAAVVEDVAVTPVTASSNMTLSFSGDCWVDIRDASGKRLLTGIKSSGETVELSGDAPFSLVLGAPTAVNLVYNGEQVDLSGYPSGRVARLSLPK